MHALRINLAKGSGSDQEIPSCEISFVFQPRGPIAWKPLLLDKIWFFYLYIDKFEEITSVLV
jgi:hypothetical protein